MRTETATQENPAAAIVPAIRPGAPWRVTDVQVLDSANLKVRFMDGLQGIVRFEQSHLTGVFTPLQDEEVFRKARVELGAVTWPGEIDLAPDAMYDEIKAHGIWILQ